MLAIPSQISTTSETVCYIIPLGAVFKKMFHRGGLGVKDIAKEMRNLIGSCNLSWKSTKYHCNPSSIVSRTAWTWEDANNRLIVVFLQNGNRFVFLKPTKFLRFCSGHSMSAIALLSTLPMVTTLSVFTAGTLAMFLHSKFH